MVVIDPNILAQAASDFLAKAQKQADHDPDAIRLHGQEIKALRETITTLQGRLAQEEARTAGFNPAASGRLEAEVKELRETVTILQGQVTRGEAVNARLEDMATDLRTRLSELETVHTESAHSQAQFSRPVDSQAHMAPRDHLIFPPRRVEPEYAAEQHAGAGQEDAVYTDQLQQRPQHARKKTLEAHILSMRRRYHVKKPGKDHRAFIWSFIDGIKDKEWARWTQEYLMEKLPGKTWPSKSPRKGRVIALSTELKWEEVKDVLAHMPRPSFLTEV